MGRVDDADHLTRLRELLSGSSQVILDTNALIYFLQGTAPYFDLVQALFDEIEAGRLRCGVSVISELELLVKPIKDSKFDALDEISLFLYGFPNLQVFPVSRETAAEAARIRAVTGLGVADSIIAATAVVEGFDCIVGNDRECAKRFTDTPYLLLDDFA